jgi:uncharacterized protein
MVLPDDIRHAFLPAEDATILTIEVSTGSRLERFPTGYNPWRQAIGVQVKAQAVEGKANKAIINLIAETLDLPKTAVQIINGQTSSIKRIRISNILEEDLEQKLTDLINKYS